MATQCSHEGLMAEILNRLAGRKDMKAHDPPRAAVGESVGRKPSDRVISENLRVQVKTFFDKGEK